MKTYKINFHSFIDIITNSSTEIYTYPGDKAINMAYEMIQTLFDNANIELRATDCYDIYIASTKDEEWEDLDFPERISDERHNIIISDHEGEPGLVLIVKSKKNGKEINLQELSGNIFETDEWSC